MTDGRTPDGRPGLPDLMKSDGVKLIAAERQRQVAVEGWTPEHDDQHRQSELTAAAMCYASYGAQQARDDPEPSVDLDEHWPWEDSWWKPSAYPVKNLMKAAALIAAEIDRILRQTGESVSLPDELAAVCAAHLEAQKDEETKHED